MLLLDGLVMVSERDEATYHEMIVQVPAFTHPGPRTALVIGGGDGGTVRELLRHPSIKSIDLVEIDRKVVEISRKYFPNLAEGFDDPKVKIHFRDGLEFVKGGSRRYDLVLIDSIDPMGPAVGLFEEPFYRDVNKILNDDGIMAAQAESPLYEPKCSKSMIDILKGIYPITLPYLSFIPTYPSGLWAFVLASKKFDPIKDFREKDSEAMAEGLKYYNSEIHRAAFAMPTELRKLYHNP